MMVFKWDLIGDGDEIFFAKIGRGGEFIGGVENMLAGERQHRKARERKIRKQTELKNNVNITAVLNDDKNAFDIFNEW